MTDQQVEGAKAMFRCGTALSISRLHLEFQCQNFTEHCLPVSVKFANLNGWHWPVDYS